MQFPLRPEVNARRKMRSRQKRGGRSLPCFGRTSAGFLLSKLYYGIVTLAKMMAKV